MNKDVVIAGYPKSGTMWVTRLVAQLLDCPVVGTWGDDKPNDVAEGAFRVSEFRCFQSHEIFDELIKIQNRAPYRIIHVVRDPRDIVVSGARNYMFYADFLKPKGDHYFEKKWRMFQFKFIPEDYKLSMVARAVIHGNSNIPHLHNSWSSYVNSFNNILTLRYEDLLSNTLEETMKILQHLEIELDISTINHAIHAQSFVTRKQEFISQGDRLRTKHLRVGQSGQWRNILPKHISDSISTECHSSMNHYHYT